MLNQSIDLLFSNENEINLLQQSIQTKVDILCSSGANGCRFNQVKVDAKKISVINTNGAGDALVGIISFSLQFNTSTRSLKESR